MADTRKHDYLGFAGLMNMQSTQQNTKHDWLGRGEVASDQAVALNSYSLVTLGALLVLPQSPVSERHRAFSLGPRCYGSIAGSEPVGSGFESLRSHLGAASLVALFKHKDTVGLVPRKIPPLALPYTCFVRKR